MKGRTSDILTTSEMTKRAAFCSEFKSQPDKCLCAHCRSVCVCFIVPPSHTSSDPVVKSVQLRLTSHRLTNTKNTTQCVLHTHTQRERYTQNYTVCFTHAQTHTHTETFPDAVERIDNLIPSGTGNDPLFRGLRVHVLKFQASQPFCLHR